MASDPGFSSDTCIFVEAIPGDGGVHDGNGVWWLSPDLSLNARTSGLDQADAGSNKIRVKFHRKPVASQCVFPGSESITVEVWVANPSLAMVPLGSSSIRVGFIGSALPDAGASGTQLIEWTPSVGPAGSTPDSVGPKCLIARVYPDNLSPSGGQFFVPDDQHVVQHNLSVISCSNTNQRPCTFKISTANPQPSATRVKIKALFDPDPTEFVRAMVLKRITSIPGYQQISTHPPASLGFDFSGVTIGGIIPQPIGPTITTPASTETQVNLGGRPITFQFVAKFSHAFGLAHIFHITQSSLENKPQGGLTLVMLAL